MIPACSSLEIAQAAQLRPIADIAAEIGLEPDEIELYGNHKAKVGCRCSTGSRRSPTRSSSA